MAQSIRLWNATYSNVPGVTLPKSTSGTATFYDVSGTTATASDVAAGKTFINSSGSTTTGALSISAYYTGSSDPSSSLGENGDIYLKVVN